MRKVILLCLFVDILKGGLIPVPFINEPEPIQRAGYGFTKKYFERRLFLIPYGIAMTTLRNTSPLQRLIVISDMGWHRILYTLIKESTGETDWINMSLCQGLPHMSGEMTLIFVANV